MIIDFHTHVKISKNSTFLPDYFQAMIKEAKANGLTALALTEHFNTIKFFSIYEYLNENYPYHSGYYDIDGLRLYPGIEVDIYEGGHILLIGEREDILQIRMQLEEFLNEYISFDGLMELIKDYSLLKIGAHPYRESTALARNISMEQLRKLDALDLNGKDMHTKGIEACRDELEQLAEESGLPIVGGSDTHQFLQYASVINELPESCLFISEIKESIFKRDYKVIVSNDLHIKVKSAKLVKKYMKKLMENEVSITV